MKARVIAYLVASPADIINLVGITSVFSYPKLGGKPAYVSKILSTDSRREVRTSDGLTISSCMPYSEYEGPIDTLVVIGGESAFSPPPVPVIEWIREKALQARRVVSVCTGAFVLAPTGVLDGKRMTTHYHHAHRLAKQYPKLAIDKNRIFMKDGKLYSTAGVTAGIDMALSLVEEDFGHAAAATIAHTLVMYSRRSGEEHQSSPLLAQQTDVSATPMRALPGWVRSHLAQRLDVVTLAKAVALTPRTFARKFELHFKTTPARWVQAMRVEAACAELGTEERSLKVIASLTGFRDQQALRRAFLQQLAMTPKQYRERFGLGRTAPRWQN